MSETNLTAGEISEKLSSDVASERADIKQITFTKILKSKVVVSTVILILSLAVIVIALFAPLAHSGAVIGKFESDIGYTGIEIFQTFYCSMLSLSDREVASTELYTKTMRQYNVFMLNNANVRKLPSSEAKKLSSISENMLFITLANRSTELRSQVTYATLALVALLAISALTLYFSASSLVKEIFASQKGGMGSGPLFYKQIYSLWLMSLLLPFFLYSFSSLGNWGVSSALVDFSANGYGVSAGAVFIIVLSILVSAFSVVHIVFVSRKRFRTASAKITEKKVLLIILCFVLMISSFLPILNVKLFHPYILRKSESVNMTAGDFSVLSDDDVSHYRTSTKVACKEQLRKMANDVFKAGVKDEVVTENLVDTLVLGYDKNNINGIYKALQLFLCAVNVFSAILILNIAKNIIEKQEYTDTLKRLKILVPLLAVVQAVLGIAVFGISLSAVDPLLTSTVSLGLGIGPIVSLLLAVSVMLFRLTEKRKSPYLDMGYDNADVSYAPYVIDDFSKK